MSVDRWRWAQKAHELHFTQLDLVRRQAETWRTGLAGTTALLSAVLLVKGDGDMSTLTTGYRAMTAVLFGIALAALVTATLRAIQAASGVPGDDILLTGEDLEHWTKHETRAAQIRIRQAGYLTVTGIVAVTAGVSVSWFAPEKQDPEPLVQVESPTSTYCGQLSQPASGILKITNGNSYYLISLDAALRVTPVSTCPT